MPFGAPFQRDPIYMTLQQKLIGTWELISWFNLTRDGQKLYPLGPDATGYISYTPDGFVFVQMAAANRAHYRLNDPFNGEMAEDSAAMKSHITYSGKFNIEKDIVSHHVTHASCPNWVGSVQRRTITFTEDGLRLSASGAVFQGHDVTAYVDWKRPGQPDQLGTP